MLTAMILPLPGLFRRRDASAPATFGPKRADISIARNTCRKTLKTWIQRPGPRPCPDHKSSPRLSEDDSARPERPHPLRFMFWPPGPAVASELKMAPHLLENTRNRLENGRPHAQPDPGIGMRFLSWRPGLELPKNKNGPRVARNLLKRLISDERIQGIPNKSNRPKPGNSRSPDARLRRPEEIQILRPRGNGQAATRGEPAYSSSSLSQYR